MLAIWWNIPITWKWDTISRDLHRYLGTRISNQNKILSWYWRGVLSWPFLNNTEDGMFSWNKKREVWTRKRKKKTLILLIYFLSNFCIPRISWAKSTTIVNLIIHNGIHYVDRLWSFKSCNFGFKGSMPEQLISLVCQEWSGRGHV